MKDPIIYAAVSEKDKVFKALAVALESGFAAALAGLQQKTPFSACVRIERTGLQAVSKSSSRATLAFGARYHTGLVGNAIIVCRAAELASLGEVLGGAEAKIGESLSPEIVRTCVQFFDLALRESNRLFSSRHVPVACDGTALLNPDGKPADLAAVGSQYEDVLCATYEVSAGPRLDLRFLFMIDAQLFDSLSNLLPRYDPNPRVQSAAEQRLAARRRKRDESAASLVSESGERGTGPSRTGPGGDSGNWNIDLLLDVELPVAVSFGECEMPLRDVLKLASGSVIELDKSVNDPVTVIVNQKPIARGEVVMIDGNYGVRITEVESTADRIRSLG